MKKTFIALGLILAFSITLVAQTKFEVKNLRTEYLQNPIGIDVKSPRFSWTLNSTERAAKQTAFEITVTSDKAGENTVWSSGKIESDKSVNNVYNGAALVASTRYYWHVDVWDNKNLKKASTETAFFETGLLDSGWGDAKWIQATTLKQGETSTVTPSTTRFTMENDMTLLNQNANIIFGATDIDNMYMWQINTKNTTYPLIRRHIFKNNSPTVTESSIAAFYSKTDLIGKERHVKIDVDNNVIKTYIDGVLVDTFTDASGALKNGGIGFRAYNGSGSDEVALYDNVVLTNYAANATTGLLEPVVGFSENFENGSNTFKEGVTVQVSGNTKLKMFTLNADYRLIQGVIATGIPMFRTKFDSNKEIKSAKIYSSALGVYDLFVNGTRVGTTLEDGKIVYDELKPGYTNYMKTAQYSTYDVTNLINLGTNAIGAQVASGWWSGGIVNGQYGNKPLAFIAKLILQYSDGTTKTITTDPTWLTDNAGTILMADIYNGETYDARKESNWTNVDFDDSTWKQTATSTDFSGVLKASVAPSVQVRTELNTEPQKITIYEGIKSNGSTYGAINTINTISGNGVVQLKKGQTVIYDFGQNMAGWVKFKAKAVAGTAMKIRFAEILNDDGSSSRRNDGPAGGIYVANLRSAKATINYYFKGNGNTETYNPSLTYFGFKYCEISASQDVELQSVTAEVVGSVTEEGAEFKTSSSIVNKLYSNVIWGQRSNFLSIPTDCPQRNERWGWTGDTQIFCKAAAYNADVASFFHKWMGDMRDSQGSNGAYPKIAPTRNADSQGGWAEAGIIVPWTVYLMYDDAGILEENFVSMEKYMTYLAAQSGGGYTYNGAGVAFGDWLSYETLDKRFVSVSYYAEAAQLMSKISKALSKITGDTYDLKSTSYANLYNKIKTEFQTRYVNADGTLKEVSQAAYLLALKVGLFPNDVSKNNGVTFLTQKIAGNGDKLSTGFLGTGILNQTLSQFGATNTAYNLLLQRGNPSWLYSVDQGATTIWERWDSYTIEKGFQTADMNSFNHYSYGAVSEWMYRFMGGIEADEAAPGFKHFILQPNPDKRTILPQGQQRITSVEAKFKSYYGDIKSAWVIRADGNLSYTATVPANTTATLYLPLANIADVVYEGSVLAENAEGVTFIKKEDGKAIYELKSGTYSFGLNTLSINENAIPAPWTIYPNPSKGIFYIQNNSFINPERTTLNIFDSLGRTILTKTYDSNNTTIDLTNHAKGLYLIKLQNQNQSSKYKIIKK